MNNIDNSLRLAVNGLFILLIPVLLITGCRDKVIIYVPLTESVHLIAPPSSDLVFADPPTLIWHSLNDVSKYQVQIASDNIFSELETDTLMTDTSYTFPGVLPVGRLFWRIRAQGNNLVWGDWSDASVRSFIINGNSDYIELVAIAQTPGTAQDLIVEDGIAYVADGQKLLTLIDVNDPTHPTLIGNLDRPENDFARNVWKRPGEDIAFLAAGDGAIVAMDTRLPLDPDSPHSLSLGYFQNLYHIDGMVFQDTIYMFGAGSGFNHRRLYFAQIVYYNGTPMMGPDFPQITLDFTDDIKGVDFDSLDIIVEYRQIDTLAGTDSTYYEQQMGMFLFISATESGLGWVDISGSHSFADADTVLLRYPRFLGWGDTPSWALRADSQNGFVYVADDRGGLEIFDLPDTIPAIDNDAYHLAEPVLVEDINTAGRTKDVQVLGNYCYLADGSGGLKIVDVTNPYAPFLLTSYDTPYAYGVWVDSEYIYLADRDDGVLIFENKLY